ncbi:MAG TPA: hypothetical protein VMA13_04445, partial [Candidatus Saccharimonadales bacterium]|nr:hypothetical protein [Candidatus Saccharimonadales bacterium]
MTGAKSSSRSPWYWIPSLYFAEGLPYALAMSVSLVLYKNLGVSNAEAAFYTSWFYLPWVIKPLWSPVVDILKTRRLWIWAMQLSIGGMLAGVALTIPTTHFFQWTLVFFWLLAFNSATHDIAADGFYMLATTEREQAFFSGIRNTAYRVATICAQGLLVILVGAIQTGTSLPSVSLQIQAEQSVSFAGTIKLAQTNAIVGDQNKLCILAEPALIKINLRTRPKSEIETLLAGAEAWNVKNGFQLAENGIATRKVSWWTKRISQPVGEILERYFGPKTKSTGSMVGDIGSTHLSLSQPPSHEVVVIPDLKSDNVSVAEGSRLTFNATNWNKSALVFFQLDSKLKSPVSTVCKLRSGNIPISWTTAFTLVAIVVLCLGLYHCFILPKPHVDQPAEMALQKTFLSDFIKTFGGFFRKPK